MEEAVEGEGASKKRGVRECEDREGGMVRRAIICSRRAECLSVGISLGCQWVMRLALESDARHQACDSI